MADRLFCVDYPKANLEKKEYFTERMGFWKNQVSLITSILITVIERGNWQVPDILEKLKMAYAENKTTAAFWGQTLLIFVS